MKIRMHLLFIIAASTSLLFTACKKEDSTSTNEPPTSLELATHADDETFFAGENDGLADDALSALNYEKAINGRVIAEICDASYDADTMSNPRKITITYNGASCNGKRTRTGVVVLSLPANVRWKDAGAALTVSIQNVRVTRLSDNKSVVLNGTQTYTNVSGGLLQNLASLQSITHTITSSGLEVAFDNGTKRNWQVARKRVFTYSNGIAVSLTGTHSENGKTNITEWGTNRFGRSFTCATLEPVVVRQDCNFRIVSGKVQHDQPSFTATFTFGLNASGDPTTCPGSGSYYGKLVWNAGNLNQTLIFPY